MILWYTDNQLSQSVMAAARSSGYEAKHIKFFDQSPLQTGVFYGLLRGCSRAMHILKHSGKTYFYVDNGYTGAQYIDANKVKQMTGTFRVVKNDLLHRYTGEQIRIKPTTGRGNALILPPSPYTAMHHDTTAEDWLQHWTGVMSKHGFKIKIRDKNSKNGQLEDDLIGMDMVLSFNSMSAVRAIQMGVPAYDTHGLFRDAADLETEVFTPQLKVDYEMLASFYKDKQYTLDRIVGGLR